MLHHFLPSAHLGCRDSTLDLVKSPDAGDEDKFSSFRRGGFDHHTCFSLAWVIVRENKEKIEKVEGGPHIQIRIKIRTPPPTIYRLATIDLSSLPRT